MHAPSSLSQWPDLPPDVLRDISGRLRDARDFVSFHALCKPWRGSHEPTRRQLGLPWLLAPDRMIPLSIFLNMRCVFSRTSYWALPPLSIRYKNWVASADGTAVWYLAERPSPSLRDPLSGAVTHVLPHFPFPRENIRRLEASPSGIVYGDGAVLLYDISRHGDATKVRAALLRPGDVTWTVVVRTFRSPDQYVDRYAVYHRGKILITLEHDQVPTTDDEVVGIDNMLAVSRPWMPCELDDYHYHHNYVLESRGELLCVSIYISQDYPYSFGGKPSVPGMLRSLWVSVHALEEDESSAPGKMHWVRKDSRILADRVLFLGRPNSFAVDASRLSGGDDVVSGGGCAYFVYRDVGVMPDRPCYVLRYNLIDDKAKFVERLPEGWVNNMYMWLFPQPTIAPIQEINEGRKWWWKKKKLHMTPTPRRNIYIETPQPQCYNTYLRVYVRNLPPMVDSIQLRKFFSKHGKVYNGKVLCKKKNKMSKKIGLVTIGMMEEWTDALAALDGLVFNGCILEVSLERRWKLRVPSAGPSMHSPNYLIYMGLLLVLFVTGYLWIHGKHYDIRSVLTQNR